MSFKSKGLESVIVKNMARARSGINKSKVQKSNKAIKIISALKSGKFKSCKEVASHCNCALSSVYVHANYLGITF